MENSLCFYMKACVMCITKGDRIADYAYFYGKVVKLYILHSGAVALMTPARNIVWPSKSEFARAICTATGVV